MDVRYIFMRGNDGDFTDSQWMNQFAPDEIRAQALCHASQIMQCSILVVERDPSTGYMVPVGFAGTL